MTEEAISVPSATVSLAFLLELRDFLTGFSPLQSSEEEADSLAMKIDSILSNYKL